MEVKCFACDTVIDAPDLAAIADAFVAHGHDVHAWSFPDQAVRNYACNYAEAAERLSTDVKRRDTIGEITIRPVTPANLADWQRFFDHDGFAGNPDWASCYCLELHVPAPPEEPERAWRATRATMLDRVLADAPARGAAWVEAYPHLQPEPTDGGHFRGPRRMYEARGFEPVAVGERDTVVRRRVG